MDKTITAVFETVDGATFAARRITSHFDNVKSVKINYHKLDKTHSTGFVDWLAAAPPAAVATAQTANGLYPGYGSGSGFPAAGPAVYASGSLDDWHNGRAGDFGREDGEPPEIRERASVRITADSREAGRIETTLRSYGGWDVRES